MGKFQKSLNFWDLNSWLREFSLSGSQDWWLWHWAFYYIIVRKRYEIFIWQSWKYLSKNQLMKQFIKQENLSGIYQCEKKAIIKILKLRCTFLASVVKIFQLSWTGGLNGTCYSSFSSILVWKNLKNIFRDKLKLKMSKVWEHWNELFIQTLLISKKRKVENS